MPGPGRRASARVELLIPIEVQPHPTFRRDGCDIASTLTVPLTDALLGTTVSSGAALEQTDGGRGLRGPKRNWESSRAGVGGE